MDVKRAKFRLKCLKLIKSNIDIREAKMFRARTTLRVNSQLAALYICTCLVSNLTLTEYSSAMASSSVELENFNCAPAKMIARLNNENKRE